MAEAAPRVTEAVSLVKDVFAEIPGTQLTLAQASRLTGLDSPTCQAVIAALEDAGFLQRSPRGLYHRGPAVLSYRRRLSD